MPKPRKKKPKPRRPKKAPVTNVTKVTKPKLPPAPIGRPPIDVDEAKLKQLASMGLAEGEMAAILECSIDTLQRRYRKEIDAGWELRNASLRRKQYEVAAVGGNPTMLIFLGKQYLGQKDKMEHSGGVTLEALVCGDKEEDPK